MPLTERPVPIDSRTKASPSPGNTGFAYIRSNFNSPQNDEGRGLGAFWGDSVGEVIVSAGLILKT